jgi:hypothetical protein
MNKLHRRELLHRLTTALLIGRGFEKPEGYNIEWDAMEPDSQYSMCYEDIEIVLNSLEKFGFTISQKTSTQAPTVTYTSSTVSSSV